MDKQTLYFERPPKTPKGDFEWTRIPNLAGTTAPNGETCLYMDAYMMREFGHAAGLGHSANNSDIMYSGASIGTIINTPTANDVVLAMQAIYNSHAAH